VPSHLGEGSSSYRWDSTFSLTGSLTIRVENEKLQVFDETGADFPVPQEWWTWNRGCSCLVLSLDRFETSGATDAGGPQTVTIRQDAPLIIVARTVILNGILSVFADLVDASTPLSASDGKPAADGGLGGGGGAGGLAAGGSGGNGGSGRAGDGGVPQTFSMPPFTIFTPLRVGARGASGGRGCVGGAGGGALQISAASMVVGGTVVASGGGGALCAAGGGGGGGAGGMLWFECPTGTFELGGAALGANGGGGAAGATLDGGAGGAGQKATSYGQALGGTNAPGGGKGGNGGAIFANATSGVGGPGVSSAAGGGGGGGSVGFVLHRGRLGSVPADSSPSLTTVGP
jgi:hypothetical protein